jgi:leucyl/phenylalanyl-tRNA--protein transferase
MAGDTPHTIASNTCRSSTTTRRAALFRETPVETLERWMLGTAWAMKPERIAGVPTLARIVASGLVRGRAELPDPTTAVPLPEGLCGMVAGDITGSKLIEAYGRSLFPFAHLGPLKWYSPAERCVLFFDEFHMAKTLRRQIRQGRHTVTFDRDFEGVVKACAGRRSGKWHVTWITPRIMHMFAGLFDAGHVHSFEVWNDAGELVGGGYGLALGSVFFTESQFSLERNTSKVGFSVLNWHLAKWGFTLNDGKFPTPTILDMGFRSIPRAELQTHIDGRKSETLKPGRWQVETDLATVAAWQPGGENADARKPPKQSKPKK